MNDVYLGRDFHRKSALDANKDQKNASRLLKEATKGETLEEWFNKEKKKPAPKAEDAEKKSEPKKQPSNYDPECLICQNEGPRDNNNGKHQHVYSE